jgi:Family of unknown function (DUF5677)
MPFEQDGFLASEMPEWMTGHRKELVAWFDLAERVNRHCHSVAGTLKIEPQNNQHLLTATLFLRALEYFQAAILMAERGMSNAAKVVLRTQLEAVFSLKMVAKSQGDADLFVRTDAHTQLAALKKIRRAQELEIIALTDEQMSTNEALILERERELSSTKIPKATADWLAKEAGMESSYLVTYVHFSGSVHSLSRSLESYLEADEHDNLSHVRWGPDVRDGNGSLCAAIEHILLGLEAVEKVFKLEIRAQEAFYLELTNLSRDHGSESNVTGPGDRGI